MKSSYPVHAQSIRLVKSRIELSAPRSSLLRHLFSLCVERVFVWNYILFFNDKQEKRGERTLFSFLLSFLLSDCCCRCVWFGVQFFFAESRP